MSGASIDAEKWQKTDVVLLDIEGTISSISFVKDVLYPYAVRRLEQLALDSWDTESFQSLITAFPADTRTDVKTLLGHVEDLTRRDIKAVYLKQLQGYLWRSGYTAGELRTPLYPDVLPALQSWQASGKRLAIFSSGSVQAQNQFFSYVKTKDEQTTDLNPLFVGKFDTVTAGSKLEKASYEKICKELGVEAQKVTFLTDNVKEAHAAIAAGVYTILADRPGNAPLDAESRARYPVIKSLDDLPTSA